MVQKHNIRRYGGEIIIAHWLLILLLGANLLLGIMLFRDWFYHEFHIYGGIMIMDTPAWATDFHVYSGIGILVLGLAHFLIHIGQRDMPMLSKNLNEDFKSMVHTLMYIIFMASEEEAGAIGKYRANQRVFYLLTVYTIILTAITAFILYLEVLGEMGLILHIVAGSLVAVMVAYKLIYLVRKHDWVAIKCIMGTGKMPEWYVKKHHFRWYRETQDRGPLRYNVEITELDGCQVAELDNSESQDKSAEVST